MVQEVFEEVLWGFTKKISQKIGAAIRWIWFGQKLTFAEILSSRWNIRVGIIVICLILALIVSIAD